MILPKIILRLFFITLLSVNGLVKGQDLFPYRLGDKWGFCDSKKNILIHPKYQSVEIFSRYNVAIVKLNDKYGLINKAGKEITAIKYDNCSFFSYHHALAGLNNKFGVIDTNGELIIPFAYDGISFSKKIIGVQQSKKWEFFDFNGKKIHTPAFTKYKCKI